MMKEPYIDIKERQRTDKGGGEMSGKGGAGNKVPGDILFPPDGPWGLGSFRHLFHLLSCLSTCCACVVSLEKQDRHNVEQDTMLNRTQC